jgi:(4-(4-[2-(gamma-L-glutamylamino)ethyl]phenoxymethyl)furan-2-yl)methanamine synthase
MPRELATGWDLGGAHLKVAQALPGGRLVTVLLVPCRLWLGMDEFTRALSEARRQLQPARHHGVTMTGELADLFADRAEGVTRLSQAMTAAFPGDDIRLYAGDHGFVTDVDDWRSIASANWHASVRFVARCLPSALFVDVGSTTTDIVPVQGGRIDAIGYADDERLIAEELVYTGVTRTPVMAVVETVPFAGQRQRLMAEHFATMADVHRLTGELPQGADQLPAADGRGKTPDDSARRLARMLGRDLRSATMEDWRRLAVHLAERQQQVLQSAIDRTLSRGILGNDAPIVGAGIGRFLVRELARRLHRPYVDFGELVSGEPAAREWAARCAPAAAVAILAADSG